MCGLAECSRLPKQPVACPLEEVRRGSPSSAKLGQGRGAGAGRPFPGLCASRSFSKGVPRVGGHRVGMGRPQRGAGGAGEEWGTGGSGSSWPDAQPGVSPHPYTPAVRAAGRRAAGGDWGGGRGAGVSCAARPASGRWIKGLRVSAGLAVLRVGGLEVGLATPGLRGRLREASSLRPGLLFLRRCRGPSWLVLCAGSEGSGRPLGSPADGRGAVVFREGALGNES